MDALEFLKMLPSNSADMVIFDPPYSIKQCVELYKGYGKKKLETAITNVKYWSLCKENVARILKNGGISIFCGWNTNAIGKCNGAIQEEILLVSHGGMHNDTLVTVERIKK